MSMITAATWVPRGYAAQYPTKYDFSPEEYDRISRLAKLQLEDAQEDLEDARQQQDENVKKLRANGTNGVGGEVAGGKTNGVKYEDPADTDLRDPDLAKYDLEHYDDDDEEAVEPKDSNLSEDSDPDDPTSQNHLSIFSNTRSLAYHPSNDQDPYITLPHSHAAPDEEEEAEEREELQILPTDNLLVAGRVQDEVAHLEVYVYEEEADNLYVHHDVMLPAVPLAVEWLDMPVGVDDGKQTGNYVAVGTMEPDIEIWDLDVVDGLYPSAVLGLQQPEESDLAQSPSKKSKKHKKKKKQTPKPPTRDPSLVHTSSVLTLSANRTHRNLLSSGSADTTIKLWDLNHAATGSAAASYTHHTSNVCSVEWNSRESTALLSGAYGGSVVVSDMRVSDAEGGQRRWGVESDVETVRWDPHDPTYFFVSTEGGMLHYFDARMSDTSMTSRSASAATTATSQGVWHLEAHPRSAVTSLALSPHIPGLLATGSDDKTVKLWDYNYNQQQRPRQQYTSAPTTTSTSSTSTSTSAPSLLTTHSSLSIGRIFSLNFIPDPTPTSAAGFALSVAGSKGKLKVWDTATSKPVRRIFGPRQAPEAAAGGWDGAGGSASNQANHTEEAGENKKEYKTVNVSAHTKQYSQVQSEEKEKQAKPRTLIHKHDKRVKERVISVNDGGGNAGGDAGAGLDSDEEGERDSDDSDDGGSDDEDLDGDEGGADEEGDVGMGKGRGVERVVLDVDEDDDEDEEDSEGSDDGDEDMGGVEV
ncbi:MAG: hypothetical protein M1831_000892 [Alyxoria varia]|nr:MAG: hypothetical protein M1831_000892 [Alyxoria varia]